MIPTLNGPNAPPARAAETDAAPPLAGVRAIHQLIPSLGYGDAMGNYALALQAAFRSWGLESEIFAGSARPRMARRCLPRGAFERVSAETDLVILQYGIHSAELDLFQRCRGRRLLAYHNVTPGRYFLRYSLRYYYHTELGRSYLREAVRAADFLLTPSDFNRRDLARHGRPDAWVLPLVMDLRGLEAAVPRDDILDRYADGATNVVFVGRVAPNKRYEHLIEAFAHYRRTFDPDARLLLVGDHAGLETYREELETRAREVGVADRVVFTGHVELEELATYYRVANVFLSLSEHEGFGVPLFEAMHFGVPVIAYASSALPETMGGAGVLLYDKNVEAIAATIHRVLIDTAYRRDVLAGQRRRLHELAPDVVLAALRERLEEALAR